MALTLPTSGTTSIEAVLACLLRVVDPRTATDGSRAVYDKPCPHDSSTHGWPTLHRISVQVVEHCGLLQDGINLYAGAINDEANNDLGRPPRDQTNKANIAERLIGSAIQPNYGGYCTPTIHLSTPKDPQPFGKIQGPCFFGGWSEVCCNFKFFVSRFDSRHREGDLGVIIKKKPSSFGGLIREVLTDADVYSIEFYPEAGLDSSEKATILAGQLLADYMLFDGNTEKCKDTDSAVICYCCFYSFFGQICPVYIAIPKGG